MKSTVGVLVVGGLAMTAAAQNQDRCISLASSNVCRAFNASSVSTSDAVAGQYPFMAFVSSVDDFDKQLSQYVSTSYVRFKYQQILGCPDLNLTDTSGYYARYTTSTICNRIIQLSGSACPGTATPLCADTCAEFAISEQQIINDRNVCSKPGQGAIDQIRSDFTICALPADSLSGNCIEGAANEKDSCGFANNQVGLCMYCAKSSPNATDSCCYNSDLKGCSNVQLPTISSMAPLFPSSTARPSSSSSATGSASAVPNIGGGGGLSSGQIAGIVVGSVLGAALIIGLLVFLCITWRRRRGSQAGSIFNQPSPQRKAAQQMKYTGNGHPSNGYENLPSGRVARMTALESGRDSAAAAAGTGAVVGALAGRRRNDQSSSEYGDSPESQNSRKNPLHPPPSGRRAGSLSSGSALAAGGIPSSPITDSDGQMSPGGLASQQSEQLASFKDYYSQDEIHPNDKVACLWAYQPRAADEFELERGDMLKVIGIWDDGWATGVRLNERAEDFDAKRKVQRDSGLSDGGDRRSSSPPPAGDIKAFPLVCVCLPEHWKKTIEGDSSTETGSSGIGQPITQ